MNDNPFSQQNQFGADEPAPFAPVEEPKPRGCFNTRTTCLAVVGFVVLCCLLSVGGFIFIVFTNRPMVPAILWLGSAQSGSPIEDYDNWVCEGSQAETFSADFVEQYPGITQIKYLDYKIDNDANTFRFGGEITYDGGTEAIDYLFIIDPDGGETLGTFGCISEIQVNE